MGMNVLLYPNLEKENGLRVAILAVVKLLALGAMPMLNEVLREAVGDRGCMYGSFPELLGQCDVLMPIGGDGTVMRAARHAAAANKPILAVNAGRVGFLTQLEFHELDHLRLLTREEYTVHSRMMLEAELMQGGRRRFSGINDIVISRGDVDSVVDMDVFQDGEPIARHRADGLIFATPTGSTAYSLSAGGPIVDPNMEMLLLTTICAHTTFNRSMVLPTGRTYTVKDQSAGNAKGLVVSVDGRRIGKIKGGQMLTVRKSSQSVQMIDLGIHSFYSRVSDKLSWGV